MDLTFYGEEEKGFVKIDPRTKVLIFIASSVACFSSYSDLGVALFAVILCVLFVLCGRHITALKAALVLGIVMYVRFVLNTSQGAPTVIVMLITLVTTSIMFGFTPILSIYLLVKTTRISHFLSAFQAMHIPVRVIIPFAVFFRFLPTVTDEWEGIRKAMAFRGISLSPVQIITHPFRTIEYVLIPMLFSSVSIMEELAAATMARGMDVDVRRSSYEEVRLRTTDYILIVVLVTAFVLALYLGRSVKGGGI